MYSVFCPVPEVKLLKARVFHLSRMTKPGPEVIILFFMLSSVEHEILNAYKYKNVKKFSFFFKFMLGENAIFPAIKC